MFGWVRFNQTAQLSVFKLLLHTRVEAHNMTVIIAWLIFEATTGTGVVQPNVPRLSILLRLFCVPCIIHAHHRLKRVIRSPPVRVKFVLIILHRQILFVIMGAKGESSRPTNIACDNTLANKILCIHNVNRSYRLADASIVKFLKVIM